MASFKVIQLTYADIDRAEWAVVRIVTGRILATRACHADAVALCAAYESAK